MSDVKSAYLLSDSSKTPLKAQRTGSCDVEVAVPAEAPDNVDTVIVLESNGKLACGQKRLLSPTQTNALRSFDGQLNGSTLRFGQGKKENAFVEQWTKQDESVSWPVRVNAPTAFDVIATWDADDASVGGTYVVEIGSQAIAGTVTAGKEQSEALGQVRLEPGEYEIRVSPKQIKGRELMRLRTLTLKPVAG
jgi:alpha-L-fucosidase